jgi:hypothetical protein
MAAMRRCTGASQTVLELKVMKVMLGSNNDLWSRPDIRVKSLCKYTRGSEKSHYLQNGRLTRRV